MFLLRAKIRNNGFNSACMYLDEQIGHKGKETSIKRDQDIGELFSCTKLFALKSYSRKVLQVT